MAGFGPVMVNSALCHDGESSLFLFGGLKSHIAYLLLCLLKDDTAVGEQMSLSTVRTFSSALFT